MLRRDFTGGFLDCSLQRLTVIATFASRHLCPCPSLRKSWQSSVKHFVAVPSRLCLGPYIHMFLLSCKSIQMLHFPPSPMPNEPKWYADTTCFIYLFCLFLLSILDFHTGEVARAMPNFSSATVPMAALLALVRWLMCCLPNSFVIFGKWIICRADGIHAEAQAHRRWCTQILSDRFTKSLPSHRSGDAGALAEADWDCGTWGSLEQAQRRPCSGLLQCETWNFRDEVARNCRLLEICYGGFRMHLIWSWAPELLSSYALSFRAL